MGNRIIISGVQLGMLRGFITKDKKEEATQLLKQILAHQVIWNSDTDLVKDIKFLQVSMNFDEKKK